MAASPTLLNTAMLRWLDELSGQGVFITDTELVVRSWNRWLERFTALPSANVMAGRSCSCFPIWRCAVWLRTIAPLSAER